MTPKDVPQTPDSHELQRYIAVCQALQKSNAASYEDIAKWIKEQLKDPQHSQLRYVDYSALRVRKTRINTAVATTEKYFALGGKLISSEWVPGKNKRRLTVLAEGERIQALATSMVRVWNVMINSQQLATRPIVEVGTQNVHELYAFASGVINDWYGLTKSIGQFDLAVREVQSHYEGLRDVEEGRLDLYMDAMPELPNAFQTLDVKPLDITFHDVVLVPLGGKLDEDLPKGPPIKLSDLRNAPLCHVDIRGLADRVAASPHAERRVALSSNEGVVRFVSQAKGQFVGICLGWAPILGADYKERYRILFVDEPWTKVEGYTVVRKEPGPPDAVRTLIHALRKFFANNKHLALNPESAGKKPVKSRGEGSF